MWQHTTPLLLRATATGVIAHDGGIEGHFRSPWGYGGLTPQKILAQFRFLPCRKWPGLRFFWTPGGGGTPQEKVAQIRFSLGQFWTNFDYFWPCFDESGHHGGRGRPPTPAPCSFWGWGDRPPINIGPTFVPPWVSSEVGPSPRG